MRIFSSSILWLLPFLAGAQPATIMTWNLLNFSSQSSDRVQYFTEVIDSLRPELLAVQEVEGFSAATYFHEAVLQQGMAMAPFMEGPDSESALFFDSQLFELVEAQIIPTTLRNINWYTLKRNWSTDTLHVFVVHLKSSSGGGNELQRLTEVSALRDVTDALPADSYFLVCGDFNIYGGYEPAYERLLDQDGHLGYFIDPIGRNGIWNVPSYAQYHTQSPRTRSFGGGASGGMDDRFDMILFSHSFGPTGDIQYLYNTVWAVGNDGEHYNDSINAGVNSMVSQNMAHALHYASDHLPVVTSFRFINETAISDDEVVSNLSVSPNPSNGVFNVTLRMHSDFNYYRVYDGTGKMLKLEKLKPEQNHIAINLRPYENGSYWLVIESDIRRYALCLVKL